MLLAASKLVFSKLIRNRRTASAKHLAQMWGRFGTPEFANKEKNRGLEPDCYEMIVSVLLVGVA